MREQPNWRERMPNGKLPARGLYRCYEKLNFFILLEQVS